MRRADEPRDGTLTESIAPSAKESPPRAAGPAELPLAQPDDYVLEAEHARGGLGRIIVAYDRRLERPVAIKELIAADPGGQRRFVREARLTARLQHPSIVPVYEAGRWPHGRPFYAMKLIEGRSLKELLAERATLRERLGLLPAVLATARAIAYAHSKRIIHRDIKPSNVVMGAFGETMVVDWGLAKDLDAGTSDDAGAVAGGPYRLRADATVAGTVLGTPAYMPPEQARSADVDERADVYALGALLYYLLAGVAPYAPHEGERSVLKRVLEGPPPPLESRVRGVPRDLAAIVHKAMARDPAARYRDGGELAADLERFQNGRLVAAYDYSAAARLGRWVARHRAVLGLGAASLTLITVMATVGLARVVLERNRAAARGNELVLTNARALVERDPAAALAWLKQYPLDGAEWSEVRAVALDAVAEGAATHVFRRIGAGAAGAFSRDGRSYLTQGEGELLEIRDLESGAVRERHPVTGTPTQLAWSADGNVVVFLDDEGPGLHVWDRLRGSDFVLDAGHTTITMTPGPSAVLHYQKPVGLALRRDGRFAAVASADGKVTLFDLGARSERLLGRHLLAARRVAFSHDGAWLASAGDDGAINLWRVATGERRVAPVRATAMRGLDFAPDDRHLVSASDDGVVSVWDLGERTWTHRAHSGRVDAVVFSPDGATVASAGADQSIDLWDWQSGHARVLASHTYAVYTLAYAPGGRWLAAGGADATVRLWDLDSGDARVLRGHGALVFDVAFAPDGRSFASSAADGSTRVWRIPADVVRALPGHERVTGDVAFLAHDRLASIGEDGRLRIADLASGAARPLVELPDTELRLALSHDRGLVAVAAQSGALVLWDERTRSMPRSLLNVSHLADIALGCDDRTVGIAGADGVVRLLDLQSGSVRALGAGGRGLRDLEFAPDCRHLAVAGSDGVVRWWDLGSAAMLSLSRPGPSANAVRVARDGTIAAAFSDGAVQLWEASGQPLRSFMLPARADQLAFSPSGRWLAAAGLDGRVLLWERGAAEPRLLVGHRGPVSRLAFAPDESLLASAGQDHHVRLWDVAAAVQVHAYRHRNAVRAVAFSDDGARLASAGEDDLVRVWRALADGPRSDEPAGVRQWLNQLTTAAIGRRERLASP